MARFHSALILLAVCVLVSGCSRQPADAARVQASDKTGNEAPRAPEPQRGPDTLRQAAKSPGAPVRIFIMTPGASAGRPAAPPPIEEPEVERPRVPTASFASLQEARDSVEALVLRCLRGTKGTVHVSRDTVTFDYAYTKARALGWVYRIVAGDAETCPDTAIEEALARAGWVEHYGYQADGTDGSTLGYLSKNYFCFVDGRWDGGDDSDSTYVPRPGCEVTVTCVPRREDDFPPP